MLNHFLKFSSTNVIDFYFSWIFQIYYQNSWWRTLNRYPTYKRIKIEQKNSIVLKYYIVFTLTCWYEYANKWSIAEFLTLFSRNVNVNKCEKTCVEYIKMFKVSNLNFKQITRLFAIYISFIFWILETFKIGNTCKSNNLDLSIQISIYIRHAEFCNGS
jgi:hypothetical protein